MTQNCLGHTHRVDFLRGGDCVRGPEMRAWLVGVGHEVLSRQQNDTLLHAPLGDELICVFDASHCDPEEHAGRRHVPLGQALEVALGRFQHAVPLGFVKRLDGLEVSLQLFWTPLI